MDQKIKFYIPDFYYNYRLNTKLIMMMQEHPEYFFDNTEIGAVYGTFPGAIWNGGRLSSGSTDIDNIKNTIDGFNSLGVPVRFTFTNTLLKEMQVYDTYCNLIMECAHNGMNEVLVNSPILEDYLREYYPNFKYIMSTTRCERDVDKINEACEKYFLVVPDYRDNRNSEFLERLQHKDKIELLINAYCDPDCKMRSEHYKCLSNDQLTFRQHPTFVPCEATTRSFFDALRLPTVLKNDEVYEDYAKNFGFSNFKIEGRTLHSADVIESYVYYLVKPQWRDNVRYELIKHCW